jgi:hypothetical protein
MAPASESQVNPTNCCICGTCVWASRAVLRVTWGGIILASVHIPVLETATGVVGLDGEAHFEVICMILWYVVEVFMLEGWMLVAVFVGKGRRICFLGEMEGVFILFFRAKIKVIGLLSKFSRSLVSLLP